MILPDRTYRCSFCGRDDIRLYILDVPQKGERMVFLEEHTRDPESPQKVTCSGSDRFVFFEAVSPPRRVGNEENASLDASL